MKTFVLLKKVPRSGGEPGIFLIFVYFSLTSSALDLSATAPPSLEERFTHIAKFALEEVLLERPGPLDFVL